MRLSLLRDGWFLRWLFDGALVLQPCDRDGPVALVEIDQPHALRRPTDQRYAVRLGPQNHALLGDEHQLLVLEDTGDADDPTVALTGLDVDDADAAAALHPVLVDLGPLPVAVFGDGENRPAGSQHLHADHLVVVAEGDALHAVGRAAHGADVVFGEPDGHTIPGPNDDFALAVGELDAHHRVALVDADGDDAAGARVAERGELRLLDCALARAHHDEPFRRLQLAHGQQRGDLLVRLHRDEIGNRLPLARRHDIGDLVHLQPVAPPLVGENQDVAVRRCHEEVVDDVFFAGAHADPAAAAASLAPVLGNRGALDVAGSGDGDRDVLVGDQVLDAELALGVHDLGATRIGKPVLDGLQLVNDDLHEQRFARQDAPQVL